MEIRPETNHEKPSPFHALLRRFSRRKSRIRPFEVGLVLDTIEFFGYTGQNAFEALRIAGALHTDTLSEILRSAYAGALKGRPPERSLETLVRKGVSNPRLRLLIKRALRTCEEDWGRKKPSSEIYEKEEWLSFRQSMQELESKLVVFSFVSILAPICVVLGLMVLGQQSSISTILILPVFHMLISSLFLVEMSEHEDV